MTRASMRPYLRQVPIFRYLPSDVQLSIAGKLVTRQLAVTETLDLRGDQGNVLCIVVEGKVEIETFLPSGRAFRQRLVGGQWTGQFRVAGWQRATRTILRANWGRATVLLLWRQDLMEATIFRIKAALMGTLTLIASVSLRRLRMLGFQAWGHPLAAGILAALLCFSAYLWLTDPGKELRADYLYLRIRSHNSMTDAERAERLKAVLQISPDHQSARVEMGNLNMRLNNLPEAMEEYKQLARVNSAAANNLAVLQLMEGSPGAAVDNLVSSIQMEPDVSIAYQNLGLTYHQLGEYPEARRAQKEALRLDPGLLVARYQLGIDYLSQGEYVKAGAAFERMLEQDASCGPAYWGKALVHMEISDLRRAIQDLEAAVRLVPESVVSEFYLGWCQAEIGDVSQARLTWADLLTRDPPPEVASRVAILLITSKRPGARGDAR